MPPIGFPGIQQPGLPGGPSPTAPTGQPQRGTPTPASPTGLQSRGSAMAFAPRNANLPMSMKAGAQPGPQAAAVPTGQGSGQPAPLPAMGHAKSRQTLGMDPNRMRHTDVMAKATSLENVAELKIEILMMKEEIGGAQRKAQGAALAKGDKAGAQQAGQAGQELHAELDRAFTYLKGMEERMVAAETAGAGRSGSASTMVGSAKTAASSASTLVGSAKASGGPQKPAKEMAAPETTQPPPDAVKLEDLAKPVPWYRLPFQMSGTEKLRKQYDNLNLKVSSDTLPEFTDSQVKGEPKQLGSGNFNTVYSVQLQKPDGTSFDGVFKPLSKEENGGAAEAMGIPWDNPQIAMRNLATVDYAKALGFDVVVETKMAAIKTPGNSDPQVGLVMERAQGQPASKMSPETLLQPDVMRETTKLQLLDHLTGQGDRHRNNYFVNIGTDGKVTVSGIDNDQCFGKTTDPGGTAFDGKPDCPYRGTQLPPVIDTEMAASINNLTPADIKGMLGDKLSGVEVDAAVQRLQGMKQHIAGLQSEGKVIDPGNWGAAGGQLGWLNSYSGRDTLLALQDQKKF